MTIVFFEAKLNVSKFHRLFSTKKYNLTTFFETTCRKLVTKIEPEMKWNSFSKSSNKPELDKIPFDDLKM
jgi:hypothetical protein